MINLPMAPKPNPLGEQLDAADRHLSELTAQPGEDAKKLRQRWERTKRSLQRKKEKEEERQAFSQMMELRIRLMLAIVARHRAETIPALAKNLLLYSDMTAWCNDENRSQYMIDRAAKWANMAAEAALANEDVKALIAEGHLKENEVRSNPPIRLDFEEGAVIAALGSATSFAKSKSWGECLGPKFLEPDDVVFKWRMTVIYKTTSRYNRKFEQRRALKEYLGRGHRRLVTKAQGDTKARFVESVTVDESDTIRQALDMDAGRFWRVVKGHEFIVVPKPRRKGDPHPDQAVLPFEWDDEEVSDED